MNEKQKVWFRKNRNRLLEYKRKWYKENRERIRECQKVWATNNPEKVRGIKQRWRDKHKERLNKKKRERLKSDPHYRMRQYLGARIRLALKDNFKSGKTLELLGCSTKRLRIHLERQFKIGMTWENYGPVWHIDHVKPCDSFDLSKQDQQKKCFHFSNLQPLFAEDNWRKGSKYVS